MTKTRKPWQVGSEDGKRECVYDAGGTLLGSMQSPELAIEVVLAVNTAKYPEGVFWSRNERESAPSDEQPLSMFASGHKSPKAILEEAVPGAVVSVRASNPAVVLEADEAAYLLDCFGWADVEDPMAKAIRTKLRDIAKDGP